MKLDIEMIKRIVIPILQRHEITQAGLFGSVVRGEAREDSDIDILVELKKDLSLFDFIGIKLELEEALGRKIDLVEYNTIKPLLKKQILKEQLKIL